jgi:hypothetical protein
MGAGPFRARRPVYVDLLAPRNHACPAGENIQSCSIRRKTENPAKPGRG